MKINKLHYSKLIVQNYILKSSFYPLFKLIDRLIQDDKNKQIFILIGKIWNQIPYFSVFLFYDSTNSFL